MNNSYQNHSGSGDNVAGNKNVTNIYPPAPPPPLTSIPQNIPYRGTQTFVGRWDELQEIAQSLDNTSQVAITSSVKSVTGMGGVGKTELALQYALRNQEKYQGGICWVKASIDIVSQIIIFCSSIIDINPPDYCDTIEKKINFCWSHWIEGEVLLIFDDVLDYIDIQPYLPKNSKFKVIVTSRHRLGQLDQLKLKVLQPEEALKLLTQIIQQVIKDDNRVTAELETANQLCKWLGYLPLGLELVGRYLTVYDTCSLAEVLELLEDEKLEAEALIDPDGDQADMTAERGLASAFQLSYKQLSLQAQELGCYLSLFKAELFDWQWVIDSNLFANPESKKDLSELDKLRDKELRKFSLLDMAEGKLQSPLKSDPPNPP